jgi:hypothetical protein
LPPPSSLQDSVGRKTTWIIVLISIQGRSLARTGPVFVERHRFQSLKIWSCRLAIRGIVFGIGTPPTRLPHLCQGVSSKKNEPSSPGRHPHHQPNHLGGVIPTQLSEGFGQFAGGVTKAKLRIRAQIDFAPPRADNIEANGPTGTVLGVPSVGRHLRHQEASRDGLRKVVTLHSGRFQGVCRFHSHDTCVRRHSNLRCSILEDELKCAPIRHERRPHVRNPGDVSGRSERFSNSD